MRTLSMALVLVVALSALACRSFGAVHSFTGPACPAGWTILYTDFSAVAGGGRPAPVVCRRAAPDSMATGAGGLRAAAP